MVAWFRPGDNEIQAIYFRVRMVYNLGSNQQVVMCSCICCSCPPCSMKQCHKIHNTFCQWCILQLLGLVGVGNEILGWWLKGPWSALIWASSAVAAAHIPFIENHCVTPRVVLWWWWPRVTRWWIPNLSNIIVTQYLSFDPIDSWPSAQPHQNVNGGEPGKGNAS